MNLCVTKPLYTEAHREVTELDGVVQPTEDLKTSLVKKITSIIIDDQEEARDRTKSVLKLFDEIKLLLEISDPQKAVGQVILYQPHIVLLEIEMAGKNGFEIVREVRESGCSPLFIFVTNSEQYIIKAIKHRIFDYLLKPIDVEEFRETVDRIKVHRQVSNRANGLIL